MAKTGVINARVEQSVRDRLDNYCQARDIKLATVVEKALVAWLNEHESVQSVEYNTTQYTQSQISDHADELETLKQTIAQQQQELERIADRESSSVNRAEIEEWMQGLSCLLPNQRDRVPTQLGQNDDDLDVRQNDQDVAVSSSDVTKQSRNELKDWSHSNNFETPNQDDRESQLLRFEGTLKDDVGTSHPKRTKSEDDATDISSDRNEGSLQDATNQTTTKEGISQRRLAEKLGIDRSYITKWQQGKKPDPKAKPKTKQAYEKWKQWYLSDDNLWYLRNE
jgi:ribosome-binding protein aMBF1 (putative translation factor)